MPKPLGLQKKNECRDMIRSHYGQMSNRELALQAGVSRTIVQDLIREMNLIKKKRRKPLRQGRFFNVHAYQNWLTGVQ